MSSKGLDYTLLTLVIIGAINWGLIGFFRFDLVAFLFGNMSWLSRIIYHLSESAVFICFLPTDESALSNRLSKKGVLSILRT